MTHELTRMFSAYQVLQGIRWEEVWTCPQQPTKPDSTVMSPGRWLGWLEHRPAHQKVVGSIPWSGHMPRLRV